MSESTSYEVRDLASSMRMQSGYVVCGCGAWNSRDKWHIKTFKNMCYSCSLPLFKPAPPPRFTGFDDVEAWGEEQKRLYDLLMEREARISRQLESPWPAHIFASMKEFEVNKESRKEAKAKHLSDVEFVNQNGRGK